MTNDVRTLIKCAVPTAAAGVIGTVASGVLAGGNGVIGGVVAVLLVIAFMGGGLIVLQRTAKSLPHLFQAMGLMLYTSQLLLLAIVLALLKHTTLFNLKAFAFTVLGTSLVWIGAQISAHMTAKTLYVEPDSPEAKTPAPANSSS